MNVYCVDFDKVAIQYKTYVEKAAELDNLKLKHFQEMEAYKKEMDALVESSKSGLIVDEMTKRISAEKFKALQNKAVAKENRFRTEYSNGQTDIMEACFVEINKIVEDFSTQNVEMNIDMVVNKSQIFYSNSKFDLTDKIIDDIKSKGLYVESTETEKESV